jgi:hypothetical protein
MYTSCSLRIQGMDGSELACRLPLLERHHGRRSGVVTGGAGGLGRLITQRLAERDCASSSPTPTTPRPPNSSPSSIIVVAGRSSWTPTLLTQRQWSG